MKSAKQGRELISRNDAKNELKFRLRKFANFGEGYHVVVRERTFQGLRKMVRTNQIWFLRLFPSRDRRFETEDSLRESIALSPYSQPLQTDEIIVITGDEGEWTSEYDRHLDEFLASWSELRKVVCDEAYRQFRNIRDQREEVTGGASGFSVIFPDVATATEIEDLFSINQIEICLDEFIRLSGPCVWDEEHGFEFEFELDNVAEQGAASDR